MKCQLDTDGFPQRFGAGGGGGSPYPLVEGQRKIK